MRGFTLLLTTVLLAVGVGVAVESTRPAPDVQALGPSALSVSPPEALRAAVLQTMGASSLEVTEDATAADSESGAVTTRLIYNAPDRASSEVSGLGVTGEDDDVVIGSVAYLDVSSSASPRYERLPISSAPEAFDARGIGPATGEAFLPLLYLSDGGAARRSAPPM